MKALISNHGLLSRIPNILLNKSTGSIPAIREVPIPTLAPNDLLIKVHTVSLNPIDVKFIDFIAPANSSLGCDFAGVISSIGSEVTGTWKTGDRVAGFVQGGLSTEYGSFAEYVKAESDLVWKIPESISDEDAATWGVSGVTAMLALNRHLGVLWLDRDGKPQQQAQNTTTGPSDESSPILIYAGSTSVGLFAIQLAKAANLTVITTCSPHSFALVKSYGADAVFDYRSSTAVQEITTSYPNITRALDCISVGTSTDFCARVLSEKGGKVITLLPTKTSISGVEVQPIMSFQLLGKAFAWLPPVGPKYGASATDRAALVKFYANLNGLSRKIKAPPVTVLERGFPAVLEGLDRLRAGKVSGSKLVVRF
jgi:NADPH:quinone reductase-like Zn-dependent oxidoreductase